CARSPYSGSYYYGMGIGWYFDLW
nr:immunoglobulin heavy chain junction region [Macaca mulatta]MOW18952.1 immunoglobulin heavy chain junction region [Macaca mulatta]MOW19011.1 immunoglobulin heavy chain junction region [Macaca mulatta]MOW19451.1 immunoglobulin heavy chain junction region [Macaca mulatta]MOW19877.1 immunoglobulin heavy chain junction region [Macaca mulatta]